MRVHIEIDEQTVRRLVVEHLQKLLGSLAPENKDVRIEVKSKQNYRSEWEQAAFRAVYEKASC